MELLNWSAPATSRTALKKSATAIRNGISAMPQEKVRKKAKEAMSSVPPESEKGPSPQKSTKSASPHFKIVF